MTDAIHFFDGHNDFLLRLKNAPEQRKERWLGYALAAHGYEESLITKLARDNWLGCLGRCLKI